MWTLRPFPHHWVYIPTTTVCNTPSTAVSEEYRFIVSTTAILYWLITSPNITPTLFSVRGVAGVVYKLRCQLRSSVRLLTIYADQATYAYCFKDKEQSTWSCLPSLNPSSVATAVTGTTGHDHDRQAPPLVRPQQRVPCTDAEPCSPSTGTCGPQVQSDTVHVNNGLLPVLVCDPSLGGMGPSHTGLWAVNQQTGCGDTACDCHLQYKTAMQQIVMVRNRCHS